LDPAEILGLTRIPLWFQFMVQVPAVPLGFLFKLVTRIPCELTEAESDYGRVALKTKLWTTSAASVNFLALKPGRPDGPPAGRAERADGRANARTAGRAGGRAG
jgi:hypothetical protein